MNMREHMINSKKVNIIKSIPKMLIAKCNIVMVNNEKLCAKSRYSHFDKGVAIKKYPEEFLNQELEIKEIQYEELKNYNWSDSFKEFMKVNLLIKNVPNDVYEEMN